MAFAFGKRVGVLCGMWRAFVKRRYVVDREQAQWVEVVVCLRMWMRMMLPASWEVVLVRDLGVVIC